MGKGSTAWTIVYIIAVLLAVATLLTLVGVFVWNPLLAIALYFMTVLVLALVVLRLFSII